MPIKRNGFYNNPSIGQAVESIGSLFAPPSATELVAGQRMALERQAAADKAAAIGAIRSRNPSLADMFLTGTADPTKQYGQSILYERAAKLAPGDDVSSLDGMNYAIHGNYGNTAAGFRQSQATELRKASMAERASNDRAMLAPIGKDSVRHVPPSIATMYGVDPLQVGTLEAAKDNALVVPDGRVIEGPKTPLTSDQQRAQDLATLPLDQRQAVAFGNTDLVQTVMGGKPTFQTKPQAIGQQPAPEAGKLTELGQLQAERSALATANPSDPRVKEYDGRIAALGRGQQQAKYDQETDDAFAKENQKIYVAANAARGQLGSLRFMRDLLSKPETQQGFGAESALTVKKAMDAFGMPVGDTSDAEVARALSNKLALYAKNEGGENLMPGALSDSDRPFLQQQVAGLGNSRAANMKLLAYYERIQQRAIDVENQRQAYVEKNGRIDEGFRRNLSAWAEANPVFPEARSAVVSSAAQAAPAQAMPAPSPGQAGNVPASAPAAAAPPQFRILSVE